MTNKIDVLNAGYIRLIDHMGGDISVVRSARVSYAAEWRAGKDKGSDEKLIRYLWKNKHYSPFESVTFTFEVKAPLFVIRQLQRHRTFSFNELSARYKELPEEFYIPELDSITIQSKSNKQCRTDELNSNAEDIRNFIIKSNEDSFKVYKLLLSMDTPRELARSILPIGTYSLMFMTGNLLNFLKLITLRIAPDAQYETRLYANAILRLIEEICPVTYSAWKETNPYE